MKTDEIKILLNILIQRSDDFIIATEEIKSLLSNVKIQQSNETSTNKVDSFNCPYNEKRILGIVYSLLKDMEEKRVPNTIIKEIPISVEKKKNYIWNILSFVLFLIFLASLGLIHYTRKQNSVLVEKYELVSLCAPDLTKHIDSISQYPDSVNYIINRLKTKLVVDSTKSKVLNKSLGTKRKKSNWK